MNPKFSIRLANGKLNPKIKKAFLEIVTLTPHSLTKGSITLPDGSNWPLFISTDIWEAIKESKEVKAIVSFQILHSGEYYAVARLYNPTKPTQ